MKRKIENVVVWCVLLTTAVYFLFPVYWLITTAIKQTKDIYTTTYIPFIQFQPDFSNLSLLLEVFSPGSPLANSFIIATSTAVLAVSIGSLAAYSLARFEFKGWMKNKDISFWFLSQRMFPGIVLAIPFFIMMKNLGLLDTHLSVIMAHLTFTLPFAVLIMRSFFLEVPRELEDSAAVDGCSRIQTFLKIALPISAPGMVSTAILSFILSWNDFLFATILTLSNAQTMPVAISAGVSPVGVMYWVIAVRALAAILPPWLLALAIQRYIVRGLTFGAVKG